jgi:hypothetical protein
MRRALPEERATRFDDKERPALLPLAQKARRWVDDNMAALCGIDPQIPDELSGRAADNWRPLLAIAEAVGEPWRDLARGAAVKLSARKSADHESVRVQLLADIRGVFDERGIERISSCDLVSTLCRIEGRPWQNWYKGAPITPNQLARQLAPFSVKPKTIRTDKGEQPVKGYDKSNFLDAFARYISRQATSDEP